MKTSLVFAVLLVPNLVALAAIVLALALGPTLPPLLAGILSLAIGAWLSAVTVSLRVVGRRRR